MGRSPRDRRSALSVDDLDVVEPVLRPPAASGLDRHNRTLAERSGVKTNAEDPLTAPVVGLG
ncbi:MAG: hypothetical protein WBB39_04175 [Candidatus Saccharimonadales bacterium]